VRLTLVGTRSGTCRQGRTLVTVLDRAGQARLPTLVAQVVRARVGTVLRAPIGVRDARGHFVVVTLRIASRTHRSEHFGGLGLSGQTALRVDGDTYEEDFDAENGPDPRAFAWTRRAVQPGEPQTGDVVFSVPARIAAGVLRPGGRGGTLELADFGVDLTDRHAPAPGRLALIRLFR
jgi:hypothetical protein